MLTEDSVGLALQEWDVNGLQEDDVEQNGGIEVLVPADPIGVSARKGLARPGRDDLAVVNG